MIKDTLTGDQIAFYEFNETNLAVTIPGDYIDSVEAIHINDATDDTGTDVPLYASLRNHGGKLIILYIPTLSATTLETHFFVLDSADYAFSDVLIADNSYAGLAIFYAIGTSPTTGELRYYLFHLSVSGGAASFTHEMYDYQVDANGPP